MYVREKVGIQLDTHFAGLVAQAADPEIPPAGEFIKPCKAKVAAIKEQQDADFDLVGIGACFINCFMPEE